MTDKQKRILDSLVCAIQHVLDNKAHERSYDNILTLCSYATSTKERFRRDALAAVEWRDEVWEKGYEILDAVVAGERPIPTREELLAELPQFEWPTQE